MNTEYQIEFDNDGSGNWLRAHHDFDEVAPGYDTRTEAIEVMRQLRNDYPDYDFRVVER